MEHYAAAPDNPMFMRADPLLTEQLVRLIALAKIDVVVEEMAGRPFFLLLDDTYHIKHFRSLEHVRKSPDFDLIAHGDGWPLASHLQTSGTHSNA